MTAVGPPGEPAGVLPSEAALPVTLIDTLLDLSEEAVRSRRPDAVLQQIAGTAARLLAVRWGVLFLRDPGGPELRLVAVYGLALTDLPAALQLPSESHRNATLLQGRPLVVEDYRGGPPLAPIWWEPAERLGIRAVLAVPMILDGEYLGSLHVAHDAAHPFPPAEIDVLQRLARLAAQVVVRTRALSAAEQRAGALETMQAVARSLEATLDLDTVLGILVERAVEITGATGGSLMLWDEAMGRLVPRKAINAPELVTAHVAAHEGATGKAYATGRPQIANDYQQFLHAIPEARQDRVTNVLAVPLVRHGAPIGTITVFSRFFRAFTDEDAALLSLFAAQVAVAIDNQVLYGRVARQQRQLDDIIRTLHDGLIVYELDGRIRFLNPAAMEMLGIDPAVVGLPREEVTAHAERYLRYEIKPLHDRAATIAAVLEQGITLAGMTRVYSDPERTVEAFYSPLLDEAGNPSGFVSLFRDVSATQELERLRAELAVTRQQEDFLSIVAHELRTPVTAIKGFTDLLVRRLVPDATVTPRDLFMLGAVAGQVDRLAGLIDDLLDGARLHAGKLDFHWEVCDLGDIVRGAVAAVHPLAGARESDLVVTGECVPVRCDRVRLEQVFINLLTNALKYSTSGPITCTICGAAGTAEVAVADRGPGIAPKDLPHVFERFFRSHDVYEHQRGLGLGLYISNEIVTRHDGTMRVDSTLGTGTTFTVTLPLAGEAPA